ncbi:hypothetical protein CspeluHIS016_0403760 [Cutaneotrichosporon spelunceum]|uniref:Alpha/beta-hydrolase n=1 Tax=Cutaneotrichosporon spelunceum TaxID=1672016 RepID=A0AAD3TVA2_9TREE|nr:hypothetical protein CspeluHIS016_0403760 [Cutaneotrichosporon spelunceum]
MRLRTLFLLPLALVGAAARPAERAEGSRSADMLTKARDEFIVPNAERALSIRGVGVLGPGAFAGEGAGKPRITALQHLLGAKGHPVGVDGLWGPQTSGAVSAFQGAAGLARDSIPGPATLGALVDTISQGSKSGIVTAAQTLLGVGADGDFGPATRAATVTFQKGRGLAADGIIGRDTWTALFSSGTPPKGDPGPTKTPHPPKVDNRHPAIKAGAARALTAVELNHLGTPGRYAAAAYCDDKEWNKWTCKKCNGGTPFTKFYASGGGGLLGLTPYWYVIGNGHSVVVAIRGSEGTTWVNNFVAFLNEVKSDMFPEAKGIQLHAGFYSSFVKMINPITDAVKQALVANGGRVLVTGHSQGAAIATLVATSLQARLSATVTLRAFATPRQGNPAWADYVDKTLGDRVWRFTNYNDIVPDLPGETLGYRHTSGEVWRTKDGQWLLCKGQESRQCGMSQDAKSRSPDPHLGPYPGKVMMVCE